ncbi:GntR family transcriptional regulator [Mangrovibrevibacter kandeliae]|uniref:GntR family transcriptional regulator n=1 Tax=Mangrovibrevibacter kandeliae TaxID=2968473 RepID=UPI002117820F|nr:GntR family transcriptional regulator [Aurantimonas sp. CSK15Z-1]MCQ8781541.1 GntR family transcriptional regulator [Aurantimonas sp. CSK15Z-1]
MATTDAPSGETLIMHDRGAADRLPLQSQSAAMALRDQIVGGAFAPGERLTEVRLAARLGISRTPLRSALAELEREGLIERLSTTGFVVARFTAADVADAIELRGVLEGTAARLAAERGIDADGARRLDEVLDRLDAAFGPGPGDLDMDAYAAGNALFHDLVLDLSASPMVRRQVEHARRLPFASPSAFLEGQRDVAAFRRSLVAAQAQHRAIAEAILGREGARAEAVMREHARVARTNLQHVLTRDPSLRRRVPGLALVVA